MKKHGALTSIGVVFMVWAKPLLQVENVELLTHIMKLVEEFSYVFPEELHKGLPPIHGIEQQIDELHFLTDQPIGVIQRRQRI